MSDISPKLDEPQDAALLRRARAGDRLAFESLFKTHHATAVRYASAISSSLDPDDIAAEAFARIWSAIRNGGGPERSFLPYLRTTIRNVANTQGVRKREIAADNDQLEAGLQRESQNGTDGFSAALAEADIIAKAFNTLPIRWQSVLWMVDVEGHRTADVAQELGLSPNSTAALTKRARGALMRAWLQQHIEPHEDLPDCIWVADHLGAYTQGTLTPNQRTRVAQHLADCEQCEESSEKLRWLAGSLRLALIAGLGSAVGISVWSNSALPAAAAATQVQTVPAPVSPVALQPLIPMVAVGTAAAAAIAVLAVLAPGSPAAAEVPLSLTAPTLTQAPAQPISSLEMLPPGAAQLSSVPSSTSPNSAVTNSAPGHEQSEKQPIPEEQPTWKRPNSEGPADPAVAPSTREALNESPSRVPVTPSNASETAQEIGPSTALSTSQTASPVWPKAQITPIPSASPTRPLPLEPSASPTLDKPSPTPSTEPSPPATPSLTPEPSERPTLEPQPSPVPSAFPSFTSVPIPSASIIITPAVPTPSVIPSSVPASPVICAPWMHTWWCQ